jgi:hypothetical protein
MTGVWASSASALIFGNQRLGHSGGAGLGLAQASSCAATTRRACCSSPPYRAHRIYAIYTQPGAFIVMAILSGAFLYFYITTEEVPREFTYMTPYITTLLVLIFASQRLRPPAAAGKAWRKGQST